MKVAQQKDSSMPLQQQRYSEAYTGLERMIVLKKAEFSRMCASDGTTGSSTAATTTTLQRGVHGAGENDSIEENRVLTHVRQRWYNGQLVCLHGVGYSALEKALEKLQRAIAARDFSQALEALATPSNKSASLMWETTGINIGKRGSTVANVLEPLRVIEPEIHTRQISPPLITVQEEKSEKSRGIEMLDRTAQPCKCKICKKTFPSRNSMFRHLTEQHQFYQENQQKSESMEEEAKQQSPRICDELNPAQWPPAGT